MNKSNIYPILIILFSIVLIYGIINIKNNKAIENNLEMFISN